MKCKDCNWLYNEEICQATTIKKNYNDKACKYYKEKTYDLNLFFETKSNNNFIKIKNRIQTLLEKEGIKEYRVFHNGLEGIKKA